MIKSIAGVRRRDGVTREQLFDHWEHGHAPFVARHAEPERYRVTFFDAAADGTLPPYDGLAELWFRDREHMDAWFHGSKRGSDGFGKLTEGGAGFRMLTSEYPVVEAAVAREQEKAVYLVKRREEVDPAQFFAHWRDVHAPNVAAGVERTEGCIRYAISLADLGEPGGFDGVAEIWWRDTEARLRGLEGVEDDGFGQLIDPLATFQLVGHEIAVVG